MLIVLETNILWVEAIVRHTLLAHQNDRGSSLVWLPGRPTCAFTCGPVRCPPLLVYGCHRPQDATGAGETISSAFLSIFP
jgi:hypothetical protein